MPGSFFDSNVLLYVASADAAKASRAETLIAAGVSISVQDGLLLDACLRVSNPFRATA